MRVALPLFLVSAVLLSGCSAQTQDEVETPAPRAAITQTPTPTPSASVAPVVVAPAPPPVAPAPAPAYVDYQSSVVARWGGCFVRLGVGEMYYDSISSTVTAAWSGGALTWSVGPGNMAGTPADQVTVDALAGC